MLFFNTVNVINLRLSMTDEGTFLSLTHSNHSVTITILQNHSGIKLVKLKVVNLGSFLCNQDRTLYGC